MKVPTHRLVTAAELREYAGESVDCDEWGDPIFDV
jgi:hypothetical protein